MTHKLNPSLATTGDQAHPSLSPFGRLFIGLLILVGQPSVSGSEGREPFPIHQLTRRREAACVETIGPHIAHIK